MMYARATLVAALLLSVAACETPSAPPAATATTAAKPAPSTSVTSPVLPAKTAGESDVCAHPPPPGNHPEWCKQCPGQCAGGH